MKTIDDLTYDELVDLSSEEINHYIDVQCAMEGIPLLPEEPGNKPVEPEVSFDLKLWKLPEVCLVDKDTAELLATELTKAQRYTSSWIRGITRYGYEPDHSAIDATFVQATTKSLLVAHREELEKYEEEKTLYREQDNAYDKASNARSSARTHVMDVVYAAQEKQSDLARLDALFTRYLALADGDRAIAAKFLREAQPALIEKYEAEFMV